MKVPLISIDGFNILVAHYHAGNPVKNVLIVVVGVILLISLQACSDDPPQFRIRNDRSTKANLQIKTSGGNTININDVEPGTVTAYQQAAEGSIEATASLQGETISPMVSFNASNDESYTIIVVTTTSPTLVVVSP